MFVCVGAEGLNVTCECAPPVVYYTLSQHGMKRACHTVALVAVLTRDSVVCVGGAILCFIASVGHCAPCYAWPGPFHSTPSLAGCPVHR